LVAHTHRSQLVAALGGAVLGDLRPTDTLTATLPLFHVGGTIFCGLSSFMAGVSLLIMSPGGLRTPAMVQGFWRLVAQHRATLVGAVPTSVGAVLEVPLAGADISAVRAGFCGAASLPPAVGERFRQVTGRGLFEGVRHDRGLGPDRDRPGGRRRRHRLRGLGPALRRWWCAGSRPTAAWGRVVRPMRSA
jgi:fatty-acyl-CoA synthase